MEYSSAEMTCVLKVNTECEGCKVKVMQMLKNIYGVYSITMDGEEGTVKISGRVNPGTLLGVLEKYGRHAEVKYVRFDGEVVEGRSHCYYGEYGYAPYAMEYPYPPLGSCPQHQWYESSTSFFPPPLSPSLASFRAAPPPLVPFRAVAPPPPPMAPFWAPPPFSHAHRGLASGHYGTLEKEHKGCTIV